MIRGAINLEQMAGYLGGRCAPLSNGVPEGIAVFPHSMIEYALFDEIEEFLFVARERINPDIHVPSLQSDYYIDSEDRLDRLRKWPLHYIIVIVSNKHSTPKITLVNSECASTPLYYTFKHKNVRFDWNFAEFYTDHTESSVDVEEFSRHITLDIGVRPRTVLRDVSRLLPGSSVQFSADGIDITPGVSSITLGRRRLRAGFDPVSHFDALLTGAMQRWPLRRVETNCELSGGMDSCLVAAVGGALDVIGGTNGLRVGGPSGIAQERRREQIVDRLGVSDTYGSADKPQPFHSSSDRCRPATISPYEENYYEAFDAMSSELAREGTTCILTGTGGDELLGIYNDEADRPPFSTDSIAKRMLTPYGQRLREASSDNATTPMRLVSSTFLGCQARAVRTMRHGIWSVNPLATPELAGFCQALPYEWRKERRIQRELLGRYGFGDLFQVGYTKEDFEHIMLNALFNDNLDDHLGTVLDGFAVRSGIVDRQELLEAFGTRGKNLSNTIESAFFYHLLFTEKFLGLTGTETRTNGKKPAALTDLTSAMQVVNIVKLEPT